MIEFIDCSKLIISIKINPYLLWLSPNERLILFFKENYKIRQWRRQAKLLNSCQWILNFRKKAFKLSKWLLATSQIMIFMDLYIRKEIVEWLTLLNSLNS